MKKNLLLLFISLFVCFVLVETGMRINGKYISFNERSTGGSYQSPFDSGDDGWILGYKPFTKIHDVKSEYTTSWTANNEGLRDKNLSVIKSGKRIMVFGDSFTEGAGAPNDSSYPRILENLLRANSDSTVQVINCGVSSSDIFFEYLLFKMKMLKYQPDYVLLTFNSSDYYDFIIRGDFERFVADSQLQYRKPPWFEPLYSHSYLVRRIVHDVYGYDYDFLKPAERALLTERAHKMIPAAMDSFQNLCDAHHIKLGVIFHPMFPEIQKPENYGMDKMKNHLTEKGIAYADALSFLTQHGIDSTNWQKVYWPVDGHFNSKGYEMLAQCAYEFINKQGWFTAPQKHALNGFAQQ